jgi:hypothetical protein
MEGDTWAHDAPMEAKRAMVDLGRHVSRLTSSPLSTPSSRENHTP